MPEIVLDFTPELKERVDFWSSKENKTPDAFLLGRSEEAYMYKYNKIIYWSDDDNRFIVEVPEFAGCIADGSTPKNALHNVSTVIAEWIDTAEILGRKIPESSGRRVSA